MIGKILYRPVREMIWPEMIEPPMMPERQRQQQQAGLVGDTPLTICRYSGSAARPPNMPMPRMKFSTEPRPKVRPRNSRSGISASSP